MRLDKTLDRVGGIGLLALIGVALAAGWYHIFSLYRAYDDEGYVLETVRSVAAGRSLYNDTFSHYGPSFYAIRLMLHALLRVPLSPDGDRIISLACWMAAAVLLAWTVKRLTSSWLLTWASFVVTFIHLMAIANEPGHPQGLLVAAVAAFCCLATVGDRTIAGMRRSMWVSLGVLLGVTIGAKINIGGFTCLAVVSAIVATSTLNAPKHRAAIVGLAVATVAMPFLLMSTFLNDWAFNYALSVAWAGLLVLLAALSADRVHWRASRLLWCAGGLVLGLAGPIAAFALQGTTAGAFVSGMILGPRGFTRLFFMVVQLPPTVFLAGAVSGLCCLAFWWLRRRGSGGLIAGVALLGAGIGGLVLERQGFTNQLVYALPFAWLPLLSAAPDQSFGRTVLGFSAAFQAVQAYPVAGSQQAFATVLLVPIAFTCIGDASRLLARWSPRPAVAIRVSCVAVCLFLYAPALKLEFWNSRYVAGYSTRLPGSELMRLNGREVARYHWLSQTAADNCDTLLTLPGLFSLNHWSGVGTPTSQNVTAWMLLLSAEQQDAVWRAMERSSRPCAVLNRQLANIWLGGASVETTQAFHELTARFKVVGTVDGYDFLVPTGSSVQSDSFMVGPQSFSRAHPFMPIASDRFTAPGTGTVRVWVRTSRYGVVVGCQNTERRSAELREWLPMIFVGYSGTLHVQRSADDKVGLAGGLVNDGAWHHVVLVRGPAMAQVFVDGQLKDRAEGAAAVRPWEHCQIGSGVTTSWPDAPRNWMLFTGDVEGLRTDRRAWSQEDVLADRRATDPTRSH